MGAHQRARAPASLRPDTSRTRCTHCISPARRVRQTDEADRATASCSQYALHPLRGATPDVGRYTRSEEVQCLRIGCSATFNKHFRGRAITPIISRRAHHHSPQALHPLRGATPDVGRYTRCGALHPMWGATPDVGRCTRCGALHPMWGATPDQKRCNAYRSGAAPNATSIFSEAHCPPDSASAHLPPSP